MRGLSAALALLGALGCTEPPQCRSSAECFSGELCSNQRCVAIAQGPPHLDLTDGWDDPPGTGLAFVIDSLQIAPFDRGFDVDDACRGPGDCIDNSLFQLGQLGNDQIRQGLLGGETLMLIEIAGLDQPYYGADAEVTVKLYGARDADVPFYPANNFQIPAGQTECCTFDIVSDDLTMEGQARWRARARISQGMLETLGPADLSLPLGATSTASLAIPIVSDAPLRRAHVAARLPKNFASLQDGILGGAIPISFLSRADNPYCKTLNNLCQRQLPDSTLLDLLAGILQPDLDLDGDGRETLNGGSSGRIAECYDGCTSPGCTGARVPPVEPAAPHSCALQPEMADGYSVGLLLSGVAANIRGVASPQ
ncbi:MAG: hypothetical protein IT384_01420 [Deltaproteobacteria bacterium]|nr:hypothetical protein [Deltaproteobacteria bacterium]